MGLSAQLRPSPASSICSCHTGGGLGIANVHVKHLPQSLVQVRGWGGVHTLCSAQGCGVLMCELLVQAQAATSPQQVRSRGSRWRGGQR